MRYYRHFRVRELGFPPKLYQEICSLRPDARGKEDFVVECQPGDLTNEALIQRLISLCEQNALARTGTGEIGTYGYEIKRHYEPEDLEAAPLLMLVTQKRMFRERLTRDHDGRLKLPASQCETSIKIASGMFNNSYVASDSTRGVLERSQMAGLFFRETLLIGNSNRATSEPLWEMDTNIKLPKMVNSLLNPHSAAPCYMIDERPYRDGEPHYLQRDVLPLGMFDIARTFEPLGSEPGLIVSQRFYAHCLSSKIPLEVRPVRVDVHYE
jgi:hypothetical protein